MAQHQRAFISLDMIGMDDGLISAVVTAERWPGPQGLVITIRPVEPPPALATLSVAIDERDLAEVQKLLGEDPQPVTKDDDLIKALHALQRIAGIDVSSSWEAIAMASMEIAQSTLRALEAGHDTSSDS